ncbi:MAG: SDR family oxidoreductase [Terriglobia bacterium]
MAADSIFLTGATGLVGGLLLRRMAEHNPKRTIYALTHRCHAITDLPNVRAVAGDITQARLGMPNDLYLELCGSVDTIVHCAASTKFTLPLPAARQVNVLGTANVLQLARGARRLKLLLHVSSTYIAGRRSGPLPETSVVDPAGWYSSYEQSKFEAEQLLCEQGKGLPWVIARLSTLVGDSRTGLISQYNYFHQLLRLVPRNLFPVIPGDPDAPVDVVADNWVAEALLGVLQGESPPGTVLHLCAGPSQSMPVREVVELAFDLHRRREPGSRAKAPSFVSLSEFQAYASGLRTRGEETRWRMAALLTLCLGRLEVHQPFLNCGTTASLAGWGITPLRTRDFLPRIMQSCL